MDVPVGSSYPRVRVVKLSLALSLCFELSQLALCRPHGQLEGQVFSVTGHGWPYRESGLLVLKCRASEPYISGH